VIQVRLRRIVPAAVPAVLPLQDPAARAANQAAAEAAPVVRVIPAAEVEDNTKN
jgi:hypothetical protein